jgi:hypothetical protein
VYSPLRGSNTAFSPLLLRDLDPGASKRSIRANQSSPRYKEES